MVIEFLSQSGPRAHKHSSSWLHPITAFFLHYFTITLFTILVHDNYFAVKIKEGEEEAKHTISIQEEHKQLQIARFTFIYFLILICYRFILNKDNKIVQKGALYESTWLCNSTLYMVTLGLYSQRYVLVLSHVVAVSIDQVLWYVDLTGWALR